jgi:hypothetical protein
MAGFKTHVTVSSILGVGYGGAAYFMYGAPAPACALAAGLCGVSGMLPDLDSDSGRPLHESVLLAAAIVPMMMLRRFQHWGMPHEMMVLAAAGLYLLIRFGIAAVVKRFTVHRGMFHSIPTMLICGEITYLLASGEDWRIRAFMAGGVMVGFLSHLILDEIWSVEWTHARVKSSFGTAFKFFGKSWGANFVCFATLFLVSGVLLFDPQGLQSPSGTNVASRDQQSTRLIDHWLHR